MFIGCIHLEHVYFYGAKPFEHWGQDRHVSFAPNEKTLFHVLHGTANAWKDAYQVEEEGLIWRANCTFVDDLGTDGNEILIYHEGDWANLQDMVDMGFTNISAKLMNDVSITSSIGTRKNPFSGTFDGNGHTLNAFILNYVDAAGVFKNISGATIKNLHVTGDVHGRVCTGGIVGVVQGDNNLIENCRVSANVGSMANNTNGPHVGGFIGHGLTYTNIIRGCLFDGKLCVLQDEKLHDSYAGVFFGWCSNPSKQKVEDSMARGSFDSSFQHKGLNYDESGKSSSVQVTNTYHFQSWKEGKRAYSITCESEAFRLNYGTPVTTYGVSGIDVYDDGITQDGTFYAGDLERVSMSIAGVEGYDFSINSFVAKFNPMDVGVNHSMVYLGSDNKLYYSNGNMRVNACRAYFVLNGIFANEKGDGINNFVLNFDNGQTGISSSMVEGSGCSDETWYSMDGRKLNAKPKAKGVYVSHGKKIFIK